MRYKNFIIDLVKPNRPSYSCQKKHLHWQEHLKIILFPPLFTSSRHHKAVKL